jgi:response regulator RpfG family c-di-GMP phosphodiesterase
VGYRVDVVGTGTEAVQAVARVPYDLVLMDSRLPGMDGLQATRAIRERERGTDRHLRIVALTAGTTDEDRFRAAGMDAVLRNPCACGASSKPWPLVGRRSVASFRLRRSGAAAGEPGALAGFDSRRAGTGVRRALHGGAHRRLRGPPLPRR